MKIERVEAISVQIPCTYGLTEDATPSRVWRDLDTVLVRVETDTGLVGWGDAFAYNCRSAVHAAVEDMVAPRAVGRDATDIAGLLHDLQRQLHIFGRYGITLFALSGLDIALWDLAGKAAGVPLAELLAGAQRTAIPSAKPADTIPSAKPADTVPSAKPADTVPSAKPADTVPGYASLLAYGDPDLVSARCEQALADGYNAIKLHETSPANVSAARKAIGPDVALMVDTNCPWTPAEATEAATAMRSHDLHWLEEPIFPPEDFGALAELRKTCGIPIAAGENACTVYEFTKMFDAGAVDFAQPSVTKVGGVTQFLEVARLADERGVTLAPHSPYFGPGWLATLHLLAALPGPGRAERFHLELGARLSGPWVEPDDGVFAVPDGPGLGFDPDPDVIAEYRVR